MRYKLIDVVNEAEVAEFGTCELCMSVVTHSYSVFIVEDSLSNKYHFESGFWSWGDYIEYLDEEIQNVVNFAAWLSEQDLPEDLPESAFWDEVNRYIETEEDAE